MTYMTVVSKQCRISLFIPNAIVKLDVVFYFKKNILESYKVDQLYNSGRHKVKKLIQYN